MGIPVGVLAVVAFVKRVYPKAAFTWLVKRLLGSLLGHVLRFPVPSVISGCGSVSKIGGCIQIRGCKKPLIVTDEILVKHGLVQKCVNSLVAKGLEHEIFDKVVPNPPAELVEQGYEIYRRKGCDCIIAIGGGSPMDTAKVIGAKVANPMPIRNYQGFFRATLAGFRPIPPFVAVPTTAGTGSETTVAAIITLAEEDRKIAIMDLGLVPHDAVLDPEVLEKLPKHITAATGMDALTHAVESFLGGWSTAYTRSLSLTAVGRIFRSLTVSYENGADLKSREEMLTASFEAGLAFTRANVGYVHAIAHQLGGKFHTPHGDANAMLLPHVLEFYLEDELRCGTMFCINMYCELAVAGGLASKLPSGDNDRQQLAKAFVSRVCEMNEKMKIPSVVPIMKMSDVRGVAVAALKEAHGELHRPWAAPLFWSFDLGYPTPKYMTQAECETIICKILPEAERVAN